MRTGLGFRPLEDQDGAAAVCCSAIRSLTRQVVGVRWRFKKGAWDGDGSPLTLQKREVWDGGGRPLALQKGAWDCWFVAGKGLGVFGMT